MLDSLLPPAKRKLLVVEDDRITYSALRSIFQQRGWQVTVATGVRQAVEALTQDFDSVILDLMLPDGDGVAILQQIRARSLHMPVIVATGCSDDRRMREVQSLQPSAVLVKPISISQLVSYLDSLESGGPKNPPQTH